MSADPTSTPMIPESIREQIRAHFPRYPDRRAVTLPALHLVLEHFRCVPRQAMIEIAELLGITPAEVHDTVSFYGFFPQAPIGDVRVWICRSISCMLRGGDHLLKHACEHAQIPTGGTTEDGKVTISYGECLGICDYAPAAVSDDGRIFGLLDKPTVEKMVDLLKQGPVEEAPADPVLTGQGDGGSSEPVIG